MALTAHPTVEGAYQLAGLFGGHTAMPASWNWYLASAIAVSPIRTILTLSQATLVTSAAALTKTTGPSGNFPTHDRYDGVTPPSPPFFGAYVVLKQLSHTAVGSPVNWQYWLLADDNATEANRLVWAVADVGGPQTIPVGLTHNFDIEMDIPVP